MVFTVHGKRHDLRLGRELVFRNTPWVPAPPRSVTMQAARGAFAEGFVQAILHPIDGLVMRTTLAGGISSPTHVRLFCVRSMLQTAGGAAAGAAAFALAYAGLCNLLETRGNPGRTFLAAGTASVLSIVVDAPLRMLGAGTRVDKPMRNNLAIAAALRDVPVDALEFFSYELTRPVVGSDINGRLLGGALAGIFCTAFTAPLDAALLHMLAHQSKKGLPDAIRILWKKGGIKTLFAGSGARCAREALASAIFFVAFDEEDADDELDGVKSDKLK